HTLGPRNHAGLFNFGGLAEATGSRGNGQSNPSAIEDGGGAGGWFNNNDEFRVDQFNGMSDNDENMQVGNISQTGGLNFAGVDQSITSGGNGQSNTTWVGDTGFSFGLGNGNDSYWTGQSNNMFDNDANANGAGISQFGGFNIAGAGQSITSGGNGQSNTSNINDFSLGFGAFSDND